MPASNIIPQHSQPAGVRYYYWQLDPKLRRSYATIVEALERYERGKLLVDSQVDLTSADYERIMHAIKLDFPTLWTHQWAEYKLANVSHSIKLLYQDFDTPLRRQATIDAARQLVADIPRNASPAKKLSILHDKLCAAIVYDLKNPACYCASGALLEHRAVCSGISSAFKLCSDLLHIPAVYVAGYAWSKKDRTKAQRFNDDNRHAWNIVEIDGKAYHVDVTFDLDEPGCRSWFLVSDRKALAQRDYSINSKPLTFPLPTCPDDYFNPPAATSLWQPAPVQHIFIYI